MWPLRLTGAVCGASKTNTSWKLCITTSTPANESDVQPIILYYTEYLFIYFTILSKSSVHHKIIILSSGVNDHICFFFLLFLSSSTSSQKHAGRTVSCSDLFLSIKALCCPNSAWRSLHLQLFLFLTGSQHFWNCQFSMRNAFSEKAVWYGR